MRATSGAWAGALLALACQGEPASDTSDSHLRPAWVESSWRSDDEGAMDHYYNLQRAIAAGNRPLAVRRVMRALDRVEASVHGLEDLLGLQTDLVERVDALQARVEELPRLRDWRFEAEALNHAILELDQRIEARRP